ncbi:hypothetical protein BgAZ_106370 [Babesia gibsoni]|uniref:Uncharacterized protein n=1 Tax=Babesia gibsoni TaxID=33632 RepID=A0AAD8UTJ8_BABGI|nr:hypothetical protein BgAZ_106370 [Babesia gibsoni]
MSLPDWKGLLKWTLNQVPEAPTEVKKPMSKEDIEFLQKAMESVHEHEKEVKDAAKVIIEEALNKGETHSVEEVLEAFETMELFYEEHPGNASSVHKTGMLDALVAHVKQAKKETVSAALSEAAAKGPLMIHLLEMRPMVHNTPVEPKLITTIAAATRHCVEAEKRFVQLGGLLYLVQCTSKVNPKTKEKAALLIYHFVNLEKLNRHDAQRIQMLNTVRNLMPLDVAEKGIQYAEVCINLFASAVLKYPQVINKSDAKKVADQLSQAIENVEQLESAKETLKEVHEALNK